MSENQTTNQESSTESVANAPPAGYAYDYSGVYAGNTSQQYQATYDAAQYEQYYQQYYAQYGYDPQQYAAYYQQQQLAASTGEVQNAYAANEGDDDDDDDDDPTVAPGNNTGKAGNILPIHCNDKMGLNPLIFSNIQQSPYFKTTLFQLKTYHEVIDEIYYNVKHLEPWEKGSRKAGGQASVSVLCRSVRGVGSGGIISTPFCLLYKLFTLKMTRKQVNGLIRHKDSPYIRALGFMYIRFTQPPKDLWNWFEPYLEDDETLDPRAGGGDSMTIGDMLRQFLTKLDWYSSLFPRIPIPIQKEIEDKLKQFDQQNGRQTVDKLENKNEGGSSNRSGYAHNNKSSYRDEGSKSSRSNSRERDFHESDRSRSKSSKYIRDRDDYKSHRY